MINGGRDTKDVLTRVARATPWAGGTTRSPLRTFDTTGLWVKTIVPHHMVDVEGEKENIEEEGTIVTTRHHCCVLKPMPWEDEVSSSNLERSTEKWWYLAYEWVVSWIMMCHSFKLLKSITGHQFFHEQLATDNLLGKNQYCLGSQGGLSTRPNRFSRFTATWEVQILDYLLSPIVCS